MMEQWELALGIWPHCGGKAVTLINGFWYQSFLFTKENHALLGLSQAENIIAGV